MLGKFRVYNKTLKMYNDFEDLVLMMSGRLLDRDRQSFNQGAFDIEFSPGIIDIHKRTIYAGDIVRQTEETACSVVYTFVGEVVWNERDCSFILVSHNDSTCLCVNKDTYHEIVGNKHDEIRA